MDDIKHIKNTIEHINKIFEYIKDVKICDFNSDSMLQDACLFNFAQIGEEVKNISNEYKNVHKNIEWNEIAGMRNKIIHDYTGIDFNIIWDTMLEDLPVVKEKLERLL